MCRDLFLVKVIGENEWCYEGLVFRYGLVLEVVVVIVVIMCVGEGLERGWFGWYLGRRWVWIGWGLCMFYDDWLLFV